MLAILMLMRICVFLLIVKIIWNFGVPYILAYRRLKHSQTESQGISLMPYMEISFWLISMLFALILNDKSWLGHVENVALFGCIAIVLSYLHLFIMSFFLGHLITWREKRNQNG
jgi:hypothetical protein